MEITTASVLEFCWSKVKSDVFPFCILLHPKDAIKEEQMSKGSQYRFPSDEGSMQANIFLWGQAMLIISDLLTAKLLSVDEIDPIRRHLPSSTRPNYGARYSTFEVFSDYFSSSIFLTLFSYLF